jgi:hypothetical protein
MQELLQIKGEIAEEKSCVSCHGVDVRDQKFKHKTFNIEEGVSCVACHGAYEDWVDLHGSVLKRDEWRNLARIEKEERYGMKDLWDPAKRAKLCFSCHIGNYNEGKVVTHAMYAAGHPPLPSVELATFSDEMPRHWEYLKEKKQPVKELLNVDRAEAAFERTHLVLLGGIVSLRESMKLLAAEADAGTRNQESYQAWPELAQFDCYACHHELKTPSWRQIGRYPGKPGRPQVRAWPAELVKLALRYLGEDENALQSAMAKLTAAFDSQPFGNAREVTDNALDVAKWADKVLQKLEMKLKKEKLHHPECLRLLRSLCSQATVAIPDYDSARQIAWAFKIIYDECCRDRKPATDAQIQSVLTGLDKELRLKLPSGQKQEIGKELAQSLQTINNYEPARFQQAMSALAKLLPQ